MGDIHAVEDYGWRDAERTGSHRYIEPAVISWLGRLGARRVLDLGCGNGFLCRTLKDAGYEVVGCDADRRGIELARSRSPDIRFEVVEIGSPPEAVGEASFDAVVSTEVVEHLYSPHRLPEFAHPLVKEGGHLIVTTPYHGYLKNLTLALLDRWDSHHAPLWEGGHIKFWSRATLTALLERGGYHVVGFSGVGRVPLLWKSMVMVARKL
ncbi:MAG: SAM-dependent methyltransferase [Chromatiales bacterium 21-64-14]|nr:MAG: SAM-dependent methyltransferase [Chromatiales bacterium 21-64-14]